MGLRPTIELLISLCLAAYSLNTWLAGELKIWEWNHNITLTKPKHKMLNAISHKSQFLAAIEQNYYDDTFPICSSTRYPCLIVGQLTPHTKQSKHLS